MRKATGLPMSQLSGGKLRTFIGRMFEEKDLDDSSNWWEKPELSVEKKKESCVRWRGQA